MACIFNDNQTIHDINNIITLTTGPGVGDTNLLNEDRCLGHSAL